MRGEMVEIKPKSRIEYLLKRYGLREEPFVVRLQRLHFVDVVAHRPEILVFRTAEPVQLRLQPLDLTTTLWQRAKPHPTHGGGGWAVRKKTCQH